MGQVNAQKSLHIFIVLYSPLNIDDVATTAAHQTSATVVILFIHIIYRYNVNLGCAHSDNGCKYDGVFINGMMHGVGKFLWSDGVEYEGDFVNGEVEQNRIASLDQNG